MNPEKALQEIESALNAAIAKGVFGNMESAAFIFQCLQTVKAKVNESGTDTASGK